LPQLGAGNAVVSPEIQLAIQGGEGDWRRAARAGVDIGHAHDRAVGLDLPQLDARCAVICPEIERYCHRTHLPSSQLPSVKSRFAWRSEGSAGAQRMSK